MAKISDSRLLDALRWIHRYQERHGYSPTMREMVNGLYLSSTSIANYRLLQLERIGWIERDRERARAMRITEKGLAEPGLDSHIRKAHA